MKGKSIFLAGLFLVASLATINSLTASSEPAPKLFSGDKELKYGQYVYVTLKDGSQTVGKIAGKKSAKKYYVNQLDGGHHGSVHIRYIRKMTKDEIAAYKAMKNKDNS